MDKTKLTMTVYQKTTKSLPTSIIDCQKTYNNISIFRINLQSFRADRIKSLLEDDVRWLEFVLYGNNKVEQQLNCAFNDLNNWINHWIAAESVSAGKNSEMLNQCDHLIETCHCLILAIMMFRKSHPFENYVQHAQYVYRASQDRHFSYKVFIGKRDLFQQYCWPSSFHEWNFDHFIQELNNHLFLFIEGGINEIFKAEIKKKLNLDIVPLNLLGEIFSYFIGSFDNFRRFINRNYLYGIIEKGIEKQGVTYERLKYMQNQALSLEIVISYSNFCEYNGRVFKVDSTGIRGSDRYIEDHLITFGKDSAEEFTNDISLPNIKDVDSIFAAIFINSNGLNIIDISKNSTVKIKIAPGKSIKIFDDMIIVLSNIHQFVINIIDGVDVEGSRKVLKLSSFGNCATTRTINQCGLISDQDFYIGSSLNCAFIIEAQDIMPVHAIIKRYNDDQYYISDCKTETGTFYRLKTKTQIEKEEASDSITLVPGDVFQVKFFQFIVREPKENNE